MDHRIWCFIQQILINIEYVIDVSKTRIIVSIIEI
jgi:hypothetical protein